MTIDKNYLQFNFMYKFSISSIDPQMKLSQVNEILTRP